MPICNRLIFKEFPGFNWESLDDFEQSGEICAPSPMSLRQTNGLKGSPQPTFVIRRTGRPADLNTRYLEWPRPTKNSSHNRSIDISNVLKEDDYGLHNF